LITKQLRTCVKITQESTWGFQGKLIFQIKFNLKHPFVACSKNQNNKEMVSISHFLSTEISLCNPHHAKYLQRLVEKTEMV
jgi:hypothetical protein